MKPLYEAGENGQYQGYSKSHLLGRGEWPVKHYVLPC